MKITVIARNVIATEAIKNRIEKQINKSSRYLDDDQLVRVVIEVKNDGLRQKVEITVPNGKSVIRVEAVASDLYDAINDAASKLDRKLRHRKEKLEAKHNKSIKNMPLPEDEIEPMFEVARDKDLYIEPMTVEEAADAMEMVSHSFYAFLDSDERIPKIIYKRHDDTYGVLTLHS